MLLSGCVKGQTRKVFIIFAGTYKIQLLVLENVPKTVFSRDGYPLPKEETHSQEKRRGPKRRDTLPRDETGSLEKRGTPKRGDALPRAETHSQERRHTPKRRQARVSERNIPVFSGIK